VNTAGKARAWWMLAIVILMETGSQLFFKAGLGEHGRVLVFIGGALLAMNFYFWPRALVSLPLSVAAPLTNLSVVTVPFAALFILGEEVSLRQWSGVFLILAGSVLIPRESGK